MRESWGSWVEERKRGEVTSSTSPPSEWPPGSVVGSLLQGGCGSAPRDTQLSEPLWTPELPPDPPTLGIDPPPHTKVVHI